MAYVCGSLCTENEMQLAKIVCMVALDEVDLLEINPSTYFVLQKIAMTFGVGSDTLRNCNNFRFCKRWWTRIYTIFWFC
jgi:hypothetical protein